MTWADGDRLTPSNLNNLGISRLTVGSEVTIASTAGVRVNAVASYTASLGTNEPQVGSFVYGSQNTGTTSNLAVQETFAVAAQAAAFTVGRLISSAANLENTSAGTLSDARAFSAGGGNTGSGSIGTLTHFFAQPTYGSGRIGTLIDFGGSENTSATTFYGGLIYGALSLHSSAHSLPSAISGRAYFYLTSAGSLYFVNGSGTSVLLA